MKKKKHWHVAKPQPNVLRRNTNNVDSHQRKVRTIIKFGVAPNIVLHGLV